MKRSILLFCLLVLIAIVLPVFAQSGTLNVLCTPQEVWCEGMAAAFEAKESSNRPLAPALYKDFAASISC